MDTKTVDTVEIELTTFEAYKAFIALSSLALQPLPIRTALKVRRLHRDLRPHAVDREELEQKLLKDYEGKPSADGRMVEFGNPEGTEKLTELNAATVTVTAVPLTFAELEGDGVTITPMALVGLEDAGLLKE